MHLVLKKYTFYLLLLIEIFLIPINFVFAEWISNITSKKIYEHQGHQISPFMSKDTNIETLYNYFDQIFYKVDANSISEAPENPLNLSIDFMKAYLENVYRRRKDSFVQPIYDKEVDAIIYGLGSGAMTVRLMALYKSIQLGWRFRKVHIITRSQKECNEYKRLIDQIFPDKSFLPNINYVLTYQVVQGCERGCELLKRRQQIVPYYVVIESCDLFASKMEGRCRRVFGLDSICLGSNIFPIKDWQMEAKIHGYDKAFSNDKTILCRWFYSRMQFLARKIHYEFIHGLDLDEEEVLAVEQLRSLAEKKSHEPVFEKLSLIHSERSVCETQEETHFLTQLIRSLGLIHYNKNLSPNYNVDFLIERVLFSLHQKSKMTAEWGKLFAQTEVYCEKLHLLRVDISYKILNPNYNINHILREINVGRDVLFQEIIKQAEKLLGSPPCEFSVLVYGSSGRNEATPYSDLEFGILLREDTPLTRRYFQILSGLILLNIINLSETILFQLNFPFFSSKESPNSKQQWFLDTVIPRGISIDIIEDPHSTKLPIATGKGISFMGTPKGMADQFLNLMKEEYFGYGNLSERLIYGSPRLFEQYGRYKTKILATTLEKSALKTLQDIMERYSKTVFRPWDKKIDFKNTFYRYFVIALEKLSDIFKLQKTSTLERIEELSKKGVITEIEASKLKNYFLAIQKLRINMQLQRKGQYEGVTEAEYPEIKTLFILKSESEGILKEIQRRL